MLQTDTHTTTRLRYTSYRNLMSFLLVHDTSTFELKKNHSVLQFLLNPKIVNYGNMNNPENLIYDCSLFDYFQYQGRRLAKGDSLGSRFGEIYIKFNKLIDNFEGLKNFSFEVSESKLNRKLSQSEKMIAARKINAIANQYSNKIVNICSKNFILQTDLFIYRVLDLNNVSLLQNLTRIHTDQLKSIFVKAGIDLTDSTFNSSMKFTIDGYTAEQPTSFWVYTNSPIINKTYYPGSDKFKIHISINPIYINDALECLLKFINTYRLDNQYSEINEILRNIISDLPEHPNDEEISLVASGLNTDVEFIKLISSGNKVLEADEINLVSSLFTSFKIQTINASHLYKSTPDWSQWEGITERMPEGIGYIVLYPCKNYPFNDLIKLFTDYWIENFEINYPEAKRDKNYIMYNERVTDTIYITPTGGSVDTATKQNARESIAKEVQKRGRIVKFKKSDKIYKYINDYCDLADIHSKNKLRNDIKSCLRDKFHITNIDCDTKGVFSPSASTAEGRQHGWNYQDVWLENSNEDSKLVKCDYDIEAMDAAAMTATPIAIPEVMEDDHDVEEEVQQDIDQRLYEVQKKIHYLQNQFKKELKMTGGGIMKKGKLYNLYQNHYLSKIKN